MGFDKGGRHAHRQWLIIGGEARPNASRFYDLSNAVLGAKANHLLTAALQTILSTAADTLTRVDLSGCPVCDDGILAHLAPKLAPGAFVNISSCAQVTLNGLAVLKEHCGNIKIKLDVSYPDCWRLHSPNPDLTAREVLQIQVFAIEACDLFQGQDVSEEQYYEGFYKCYEFASPLFKSTCPDVGRFIDRLRFGPHGGGDLVLMKVFKHITVEDKFQDEDHQVFRVTFSRAPTPPTSKFVVEWTLAKQEDGCWLTHALSQV